LQSFQGGTKGVSNYFYTNYYYHESQLAGGQDANGIYTFSYDTQNRLNQIDYNIGAMCAIQYDGNGRISNQIWTFKPPVADNIIWIGPPPPPNIYRNTYNSAGQLTMQRHFKLNAPGDSSLTAVRTYQYPNTATHNYASLSWISYGKDTVTTNSVYEYDNKVNPFLQSAYSLTSTFSSTDNNITKVVITQLSGQVVTFTGTSTYTYTYTNNGYPVTQTFTSDSSTEGFVTTFTYANCH
jgi:hypothetical protein